LLSGKPDSGSFNRRPAGNHGEAPAANIDGSDRQECLVYLTTMEQLGLDLAPQRQVFTVSELTEVLRAFLEDTFGQVWVSGEISNCRLAPSGHYYFVLKDRDAQLRCVCFRLEARYLKVKPQDGLAVTARGRISVYSARGEYQMIVETLEPQGYGALQLAFEQLKKKLAAEGLFEEARKRPLPVLPRTIGIVTSPSGAAIADMLRILERRFTGLRVLIYPVLVQGEEAPNQIVRALKYFGMTGCADVVIVGRGGGSLEDLWAFNKEAVARAIAACPVPVISAVGHQTDFTIADFVADLRAPTPSAAAELVVRQKSDLLHGVESLRERALRALRYKLATSGRELLERSVDRAVTVLRRKLAGGAQRTDELHFQLRQSIVRRMRLAEGRLRDQQHALAGLDFRVRLARSRSRLEQLRDRLPPLMRWRLERNTAALHSLTQELAHLSPLAILERGYAIVQTPAGSVLREAAQTALNERLNVRLHRGRLGVRVEETQ
jgi:exodeoxyribonuclease VII large subunit